MVRISLVELFPVTINGLIVALLVSPFIFAATALTILRYGIGFTGSGMGLVVLVIALAVSLGVDKTNYEAIAQGKSEEVRVSVSKIQEKLGNNSTSELRVLVKDYAIFQFKEGCRIGLLWLIPFVVIDLLSVHISGMLGVRGLSESSIPMALKLFLLLSVTGVDKIMEGISLWMK